MNSISCRSNLVRGSPNGSARSDDVLTFLPHSLPQGMAVLYPGYCEKFGWMLDDSVLESMTAKNAEKVKEHDSK